MLLIYFFHYLLYGVELLDIYIIKLESVMMWGKGQLFISGLDASIFGEEWWSSGDDGQGCWLITSDAGSSPHVANEVFQMIFHD